MKILTPEQMREVDRLTIAAGIPGLILMENAACRFVEFLMERYSPLHKHRIVIVCGKGNNGGDGLAIARQLMVRFGPAMLQVYLLADPSEMTADGIANYTMYVAAGGDFAYQDPDQSATIVVDAILGTGIKGPARGLYLDWIRRLNSQFPHAKIVAVDTPSGLIEGGEYVHAHHTVTFAAPKLNMVLSPLHEAVGELVVARIGALDRLVDSSPIALSELAHFSELLAPRKANTHKGNYGHVLVAGGSRGKTGAVLMSGLAALRAGAGLVTAGPAAPGAFDIHPELMSFESTTGDELPLERKTVLAIGPGLGMEPGAVSLVRHNVRCAPIPTVIDADALNIIARLDEDPWPVHNTAPRVLTPHPGEMARLMTVTGDRIADASALAARWRCCVVLKGDRTVIAFEDGSVWINPTGSPALAKAGSGDILTGLIAGFIAQFPDRWQLAVRCAVYLHGRAGDLAARECGDKGVLATDLLRYLYAGL